MAKQIINGLDVSVYKHETGTAFGLTLAPLEDVVKLKEFCDNTFNHVESHYVIGFDNICSGFFFCN